MYNLYDTIAAIATAPGESALAIARLSGAKAKTIAEKMFKGGELENRKAVFGKIVDSSNQTIDEVVTIFYQAPHSYSGENMVEIICHGGYVISQQIVSLACALGARPAQPGEFTLRAFVNGKVDLTEAEAINSIIHSRTQKAKDLAIRNLEGKLRHTLEAGQSKLFDLLTVYEAQIDFGDDEIGKLPNSAVVDRLNEVRQALLSLLDTYDIGRIADGRMHIAIVGAPNVGKSTLFNALLKAERAIVTEIPGTTRDYLSEYINIDGYPVILTDTAGIRPPNSSVEAIGIERTDELITESDLCLFVVDASRVLNDDDHSIAEKLTNHKYLLVVNKIDSGDIALDPNQCLYGTIPVAVSANKGDGLPALIAAICQQIVRFPKSIDNGVLLSNRQNECAKKALSLCGESISMVEAAEPEEAIAATIRECLNSLGEMVGKITSDDILNQIFNRFCIGK